MSEKSLKICGLMNEEDVKLCLSLGVNRIGFVTEFPVDVPWNISTDKAMELRRIVPKNVETVVVTAGECDTVIKRIGKIKPSFIQTNCNREFNEMKDFIDKLADMGVGVIGKYPTNKEDQIKYFGTEDYCRITDILCNLGVKEILIDPRSMKNAGEKKLSADTELVSRVVKVSRVPVILAGGITPLNMTEKLLECGAHGVDVMNGSEDAPGHKSKDKIISLVSQIKKI